MFHFSHQNGNSNCSKTIGVLGIILQNLSSYLLASVCLRVYIPVVPHEAVPEVSKSKINIKQNKHVPIELFVTTLIEPFFLMTRTKLASVDFVAARDCIVLDGAKSLPIAVAGRSPQRHATLPTHQTVPSLTPYYKVLTSTTLYYKELLQYYSVIQSTTPELLCTTK